LGDAKHPSPDPKHPNNPNLSGIKTNTTLGGRGFNELRFNDTKGKQQVFIHAERNMDTRIKSDCLETIGGSRHLTVGGEKDGKKFGDQCEAVFRDKHLHVHRDHIEKIEGNMTLLIGGADGGGHQNIIVKDNRNELIEKSYGLHVKKTIVTKADQQYQLTTGSTYAVKVGKNAHVEVVGKRKEKVGETQHLTVGQDQQEQVGGNHALEAAGEIHLKAGTNLILEAGLQLTLKVGGNFIDIGPAGISIVGTPAVLINSGGAPGSGSGSSPEEPESPVEPPLPPEAKPIDPTPADDARTGDKSAWDKTPA
jgi:type VI secretion system secreted protein VgrG